MKRPPLVNVSSAYLLAGVSRNFVQLAYIENWVFAGAVAGWSDTRVSTTQKARKLVKAMPADETIVMFLGDYMYDPQLTIGYPGFKYPPESSIDRLGVLVHTGLVRDLHPILVGYMHMCESR